MPIRKGASFLISLFFMLTKRIVSEFRPFLLVRSPFVNTRFLGGLLHCSQIRSFREQSNARILFFVVELIQLLFKESGIRNSKIRCYYASHGVFLSRKDIDFD